MFSIKLLVHFTQPLTQASLHLSATNKGQCKSNFLLLHIRTLTHITYTSPSSYKQLPIPSPTLNLVLPDEYHKVEMHYSCQKDFS